MIQEGDIGPDDIITVIEKPNHDLSLRDVFRIYTKHHEQAERILNVKQMSTDWQRWAKDIVQKNNKGVTKSEFGCC